MRDTARTGPGSPTPSVDPRQCFPPWGLPWGGLVPSPVTNWENLRERHHALTSDSTTDVAVSCLLEDVHFRDRCPQGSRLACKLQ